MPDSLLMLIEIVVALIIAFGVVYTVWDNGYRKGRADMMREFVDDLHRDITRGDE